MRFNEIFSAIRFIEAVLLVAAIVTLFGLSDRKIPIGLLTLSLMLNLADRVLISQSSYKKDKILQQQEKQLKSILTDAEERPILEENKSLFASKSLESRIEMVKSEYKTLDSTVKSILESMPHSSLYEQIEAYTASVSRLETESNNNAKQVLSLSASISKLEFIPDNLSEYLKRLVETENIVERLAANIEGRNESQRFLQEIKNILLLIRPYEYSLVLNANESRECLEEALKICNKQLILVVPWLRKEVFRSSIITNQNKDLKYLFDEALKRKVKIHIGFGHLQDAYKNIDLKVDESIELKYFLDSTNNRKMYSALETPWFKVWRNKYDLKLKLIGTHQKYLVCDEKFAMIGSHNFLSSGPDKPDLELGFKTNDPEIIKNLISQLEKERNFLTD